MTNCVDAKELRQASSKTLDLLCGTPMDPEAEEKKEREKKKELKAALLSAFPYLGDFQQVVYTSLGITLDEISEPKDYDTKVFQAIQWAYSQGKDADLVNEALACNPRNSRLDDFARRYGYKKPGRVSTWIQQNIPTDTNVLRWVVIGAGILLSAIVIVFIVRACTVGPIGPTATPTALPGGASTATREAIPPTEVPESTQTSPPHITAVNTPTEGTQESARIASPSPIQTATPLALACFVDTGNNDRLSLRPGTSDGPSRPTEGCSLFAWLDPNQQINVVARNTNGIWLKVQTKSNDGDIYLGWANPVYVRCGLQDSLIASLPIEEPIPQCGNAISFRGQDIQGGNTGSELNVTIAYTYTGGFGDSGVYIGAYALTEDPLGRSEIGQPTFGNSTQITDTNGVSVINDIPVPILEGSHRAVIGIRADPTVNGITKHLRFCMYLRESGQSERKLFYCHSAPYVMHWQHPPTATPTLTPTFTPTATATATLVPTSLPIVTPTISVPSPTPTARPPLQSHVPDALPLSQGGRTLSKQLLVDRIISARRPVFEQPEYLFALPAPGRYLLW